ncbi:hypothetical protein ACTWPT_34505 [Nonomuraea sp. 3N208]|uniref:hypothetical protein n=1 Tax=Nonomuraea sp. 3N208 TaxID=3457421 RepID=UPI003FD2E910
MAAGREAGWDLLALSAALIAVIMSVWYMVLIAQEGGRPAIWFLGLMAVSALLATYGVARAAPRRRAALGIAGTMLAALGILALASIGLPILAAAASALTAAMRGSGGTVPRTRRHTG